MISTGTNIDDTIFEGGLPEGCLLNIHIPSASDTSSFIHQLIEYNSDKPTLFISTALSESSIQRSFNNYGIISDNNFPQIEDLSRERDRVQQLTQSVESRFPEDSLIVIDSLTQLEQADESTDRLFDELNQAVEEKNMTVVFLTDKENSDVISPETNRITDGILSFSDSYDNEDRVIYLEVNKLEDNAGHEERYAITFNGDGELQNDTMRGI